MAASIYEFGDFQLDCGRFELLRNGMALRVERKPMDLLILLASRQGQLVSRTEIAQTLWSSEVFVDTEHGINTAIRKLRHLLRDDSENSRFIQTVTGMGYRFVAPVLEGPEPGPIQSEAKITAGTNNGELPAVSRDIDVSQVDPFHADAAEETSPQSRGIESHLRPYLRTFVILLLMLGAAAWYIVRPLPSLRVLSYMQITHDGGHKVPVGTDGARLTAV